jgi:inosine/xanthosine triphosphate pyrophosphatase family protein
VATCTLGVIDLDTLSSESDAEIVVQTFGGEVRGTIVKTPKGGVKHGKNSWNTVFVPEGETRTFGEIPMEEQAKMSHRHHAFAAFLESI